MFALLDEDLCMNDQKEDGTYLNQDIEKEKMLCARYEREIGPALKKEYFSWE